jgi:hypothetical protein
VTAYPSLQTNIQEKIMSKKYKRQVRKEVASEIENRQAASAPGAVSTRSAGTSQQVFNPDYTYVIRDLRRIGILVGSFVTILVILSFFLH